jgi:hypothetical protein
VPTTAALPATHQWLLSLLLLLQQPHLSLLQPPLWMLFAASCSLGAGVAL